MPRMIREYGAAGGGAVPPTQPKKRPLPPKLFGGWTATLEDPGSYQSQTIDRAEDLLGGEDAIDETQPKEIFKGLNRSEQQKRAMELRKLSMTGGVPMRESTSPRLGSNRWWNNINEKVTNNPEIGKFFSEQIDKVLVNELRSSDLQGPGPIGSMTPLPKGKMGGKIVTDAPESGYDKFTPTPGYMDAFEEELNRRVDEYIDQRHPPGSGGTVYVLPIKRRKERELRREIENGDFVIPGFVPKNR
jgi:hypothetical protein